MTDDSEIRRAYLIDDHLGDIYRTYNREKAKRGRDLLLQKTMEKETTSLDTVRGFCRDEKVTDTFRSNARSILQGHLSKARYNTCLGLLAARLMFQ